MSVLLFDTFDGAAGTIVGHAPNSNAVGTSTTWPAGQSGANTTVWGLPPGVGVTPLVLSGDGRLTGVVGEVGLANILYPGTPAAGSAVAGLKRGPFTFTFTYRTTFVSGTDNNALLLRIGYPYDGDAPIRVQVINTSDTTTAILSSPPGFDNTTSVVVDKVAPNTDHVGVLTVGSGAMKLEIFGQTRLLLAPAADADLAVGPIQVMMGQYSSLLDVLLEGVDPPPPPFFWTGNVNTYEVL